MVERHSNKSGNLNLGELVDERLTITLRDGSVYNILNASDLGPIESSRFLRMQGDYDALAAKANAGEFDEDDYRKSFDLLRQQVRALSPIEVPEHLEGDFTPITDEVIQRLSFQEVMSIIDFFMSKTGLDRGIIPPGLIAAARLQSIGDTSSQDSNRSTRPATR